MGDMDDATSALIARLLQQDQQQLATEYNPYLSKGELSEESDGGGGDGDFVPDELRPKKGKRKAPGIDGSNGGTTITKIASRATLRNLLS